MLTRQTRIFVPSSEPLQDWAETLLGRVLLPLLQAPDCPLIWFWFSRYGAGLEDSQDCSLGKISAAGIVAVARVVRPDQADARLRLGAKLALPSRQIIGYGRAEVAGRCRYVTQPGAQRQRQAHQGAMVVKRR